MDKIKSETWTQTTWPHDPDYAKKVKNKCWMAECGRGKIFLLDLPEKSFPFVSSFGANSDRSFSGCFYGKNVLTLAEAKSELEKREF